MRTYIEGQNLSDFQEIQMSKKHLSLHSLTKAKSSKSFMTITIIKIHLDTNL
jgi:hypothetical protein